MRTYWIMTILLLLCFTFAGCAAGKKVTEEKVSGNTFITEKIKFVHEKGSNKVKINGQENDLEEGQVAAGKKKGRKDLDDMLDTIENSSSNGDVATFYNDTCWWYWNGTEWKKKCIP